MDDLKTCCPESQQTNEVIKIGLIHAIDDSKEKLTAKKKHPQVASGIGE